MNVLIWFKRDLRVHNHPALSVAAELGRVLPLYIAEPDYWAQQDASARQWRFTAECLDDLRMALAGFGAPLVVRMDDAVPALEKLCRAQNIRMIVSHAETGSLWTQARNRRVAAWAQAAGIEWRVVSDTAVAEPLSPALSVVPGVEPGVIPSARALRLADDACPHGQSGGRARGLLAMESFLTRRAGQYQAMSQLPLLGERASSRLSPYISLGAVSPHEVAIATTARQAERPGGDWTGSLRQFQTRLATRRPTLQMQTTFPEMERSAMQPEADLQRESDAMRLAAWVNGQTGLPFLDATMRYLAATGWLDAKARAMVTSVACYHLWLEWRDVGAALARRLTDYEPGLLWPEVQRIAGVAIGRPAQISNPVQQGWALDPTGGFTRRWVPELALVPDAYLQEPWKWSGSARLLGRRYPEPVVDLVSAARFARQSLATLRPKRRRDPYAGTADVVEGFARKPHHKVTAGQLLLDL